MDPSSDVFIGLDLGTTSAKASAYRLGVGEVAAAHHEYSLLLTPVGYEEQSPDAMVNAAFTVLTQVVTSVGSDAVAGIGCSTAMHGLIGLDAQGRALTELVTWADSRATDICQRWHEDGLDEELRRRSGTPVHPMAPVAKLAWFQAYEPELWEQVRWWVGLKDYLLLHLTGQLVSELSSASGTGLLDLYTHDWSTETLGFIGLSPTSLPPIHATTDHATLSTTAASRVGLHPDVPVVFGAGDGPLGNLGSNAMEKGIVGLSIGTSAAVRMIVPQPMLDDAGVLFCYALTEKAWAVGAPLSNGGIVMRWLLDLVGPDLLSIDIAAEPEHGEPDPSISADAALVSLAAEVPPGAEGLVMIPYLLAERAPLWQPELTGSLLGLRRHHGRGHLVRAAMEGIAMQLATIVDALDTISPVHEIRATGGVFQTRLWTDIITDVLNRPVRVLTSSQGSSLGAAALAAYAIGAVSELAEAVQILNPAETNSQIHHPNSDIAEFYREMRSTIPDLIEHQQRIATVFSPSLPRDSEGKKDI